jgi:predicted ferric reductase
MSSQLWWYVARATGYTAWVLTSTSVISGLLLSTRLARRRLAPAWVLDLHRFLGGAALTFTALHLAGLVADDHVHFGPVEALVPFGSPWRPAPVALGVVALYLLAAVEATSLLMRHLPRRLWRSVHLSSYVLFWLATFHLLTAGSDAANPLSQLAVALVIGIVVFLSLVRVLARRGAHPPPARAQGGPAYRRSTLSSAGAGRHAGP